MKLDLTQGKELDFQVREIFNEIANQSRGDFTQLIARITQSSSLQKNLDWWVQRPASRNTFNSPLFYYYCALHLVDELRKRNHSISEIVVDSVAFHNVLQDYLLKNNYNIPITGPSVFPRVILLNIIYLLKILYLFIRKLFQFRCARKTNNCQKDFPNLILTLIDIFILPGFIEKDRYYNGLWDNLSSEYKKSTYFVPTLMVPSKDMYLAYKKLRTSNRNFLIKEDYLKMKDLFYAFSHYIRIFRIKVNSALVLDVDISLLVIEELRAFKGYGDAVEALLNYRFARSLNKNGIRLRLVIDWFENQVVDKGWNAGFSHYYPNVKRVGYMGYFPSKLYLCTFPSKYENESKVLPSVIAVIGKKLIDSTKEFDSSLKLEVVPAFRFQYIWDEYHDNLDPFVYRILIVLPGNTQQALDLIKSVKKSTSNLGSNNCHYYFKLHPLINSKTIKTRLMLGLPGNYSIINLSFSESLFKSNLVISTGITGAVYESLARGIPTIIFENPNGLNFTVIPTNIPEQIWRYCRTYQDISDAIRYYSSLSTEELERFKKIGSNIRQEYFEPVTKKGVYRFLELDD